MKERKKGRRKTPYNSIPVEREVYARVRDLAKKRKMFVYAMVSELIVAGMEKTAPAGSTGAEAQV